VPSGCYTTCNTRMVKVKVKCTIVQALRLNTGRTAYRGNRGIDLLFLDHGIRRGWSASRPGRFTPGKDTVLIAHEARWAPGPVWTGVENLVPTGIRFPGRPARSHSLYRLQYPAHKTRMDLCVLQRSQNKQRLFLWFLQLPWILCWLLCGKN